MEQELPPIITWDNAWNIGHPEIDDQAHARFIPRKLGQVITL
jgi:hypothetical protein